MLLMGGAGKLPPNRVELRVSSIDLHCVRQGEVEGQGEGWGVGLSFCVLQIVT